MDFGYFGLMGYRERGTPPRRVFDEHVEQVRQADATGLAIAWFAEHHFSNYCICPSPLIMAAHCAPVTEHIKLAPAVIVTPLYEPARVLAEIGMVDCLSGGRLVLGVGSGYQPYEFERFGVDIANARPMLPKPTMPTVCPESRRIFGVKAPMARGLSAQLPARVLATES